MSTVKAAIFSSLLLFLGTVESCFDSGNFDKQILQRHESGGDTEPGTDYGEGMFAA